MIGMVPGLGSPRARRKRDREQNNDHQGDDYPGGTAAAAVEREKVTGMIEEVHNLGRC